MNCRETQVAIALHLGNDDADSADWEQARRHASTCDSCRQHYKKLKASLAVLEQSETEPTYEVQESLWPAVESRLGPLPGKREELTGRSWAPLISLTVACLFFLMVWVNPPQEPNSNGNQVQSGKSMGVFSNLFQPRTQIRPEKSHPDLDKDEQKIDEL